MNLSKTFLDSILHYDKDTGHLTWKPRPLSMFSSLRECNRWNSRYSGKRAGNKSMRASGGPQRFISINGKSYQEHRIIWVIVTGESPPIQIDHLDRDASNNSWDNLSSSDSSKNMLNKSIYKCNTSGATGVYWHKRDRKWEARCRVGGHLFNIGRFDNRLDAELAVRKFRSDHGFSSGHGMERPS